MSEVAFSEVICVGSDTTWLKQGLDDKACNFGNSVRSIQNINIEVTNKNKIS